MQNFHRRFDWHYIDQIYGGDFAKFHGLLSIYELYSLEGCKAAAASGGSASFRDIAKPEPAVLWFLFSCLHPGTVTTTRRGATQARRPFFNGGDGLRARRRAAATA